MGSKLGSHMLMEFGLVSFWEPTVFCCLHHLYFARSMLSHQKHTPLRSLLGKERVMWTNVDIASIEPLTYTCLCFQIQTCAYLKINVGRCIIWTFGSCKRPNKHIDLQYQTHSILKASTVKCTH